MKIIARPAFKNKIENPYNYLLYSNLEKIGVSVDEFSIVKSLTKKYDILHLHWPEGGFLCRNIVRATYLTLGLLILIAFSKLKGTKIVWTGHNLRSHDNLYPKLESLFWRIFIKQVDGFISLSSAAAKNARAQYPILQRYFHTVTPHGHYRDIYPNNISKEEARRILKIDAQAKVIAFVGNIRPYKNVPHLIKIFKECSEAGMFLLVAGQPDLPETKHAIEDAVGEDTRVKLFLNKISDDKLQLYFNASDLVVLPYLKILNSGTALLSLSFDRPVLVPDMGSLEELQEIVGKEWVKTYAGNLTGNDLIQAANSSIESAAKTAPLQKLSWEAIARETLHFYKKVADL